MPSTMPSIIKPTLADIGRLAGRWRQHPRYQNCRVHWMFHEGSGLTATDLSGWEQHGTFTNIATSKWTPGERGAEVLFDTSNNYIVHTALEGIGITIYAIHFRAVFTAAAQLLTVCRGGGGGGGRSLDVFRNTDDKLNIAWSNGTNMASVQDINVDQYYDIGLQIRVPFVDIYIDGAFDSTVNIGSNGQSGVDRLLFGVWQDLTSLDMQGQLVELRLYDGILPASVFQSLSDDPYAEFAWTATQSSVEAGGLALPIAAYHYNHHLGSMA